MIDLTIDVKEIPLTNIPFQSNFSIESQGLSDYTHGFYKYPCKFIPHVPRWVIKKFGEKYNGAILDPFSGSGTTLVESVLHKRNSLGGWCRSCLL